MNRNMTAKGRKWLWDGKSYNLSIVCLICSTGHLCMVKHSEFLYGNMIQSIFYRLLSPFPPPPLFLSLSLPASLPLSRKSAEGENWGLLACWWALASISHQSQAIQGYKVCMCQLLAECEPYFQNVYTHQGFTYAFLNNLFWLWLVFGIMRV